MKKYIPCIIVFLIVFSFLSEVLIKRDVFLSRYDAEYWRMRYEESNWAKGWESKTPLGDPELYSYAGWRQIKGDDPTKINTEMPPLGKYFLGLSILFFKNQYIASLIFGSLLLLITFLIAKKILQDLSWSLLPVLVLSLDKLFREDLSTSMLDLPFSFFIACSFYFLIKGRENRWFYVGLTASLGAVSATKIYLVGFGLVGVVFLYLVFLFLIFRYKDIFFFLLSLPAFLLVYFGSYVVYFLNGRTLSDFKYLHFWIRHFARVQVENYPKFEILRILLLGKWKTWWEGSGIVKITSWNPFWTISTLLAPATGYFGLKEKNLNILILLLWIFSLLVMYSFGVPYPRYLLPILPALYIVLLFSLKKTVEAKLWKKRKR